MSTKTEKTVATELREAAAKLRETARWATKGPWERAADALDRDAPYGDNHIGFFRGDYLTSVADAGDGEQAGRDAAWICLANPLLAEPLASWLEKAAKDYDEQVISDQPECPRCDEGHDHGTLLFHDGGCGGVVLDVGDDRCECFTGALAAARVLNGSAS